MPKLIPKQYGKILYDITYGKDGEELDKALSIFATFLRKEQVLSKLQYIVEEYIAYGKEKEGIVSLHVTSARELSKEMIGNIEQAFERKAEITQSVDKELIGGLVVKAGDTILDGSVQTQLKQLKQHLSN
ncbi:MAG: ATP synthase F1 subunit delta [Candidatus Magasanikbacteria bacterium]|jgi:F-type H+-transporting ATPase subunit delta|nr:ATP synthase F1 subunit delta [Candidatus Magasanikbacteria bacterium]MBT4071657.1 ATP synthase F1 subunit delta [Candidatus Magasanikbacteria bacterium]